LINQCFLFWTWALWASYSTYEIVQYKGLLTTYAGTAYKWMIVAAATAWASTACYAPALLHVTLRWKSVLKQWRAEKPLSWLSSRITRCCSLTHQGHPGVPTPVLSNTSPGDAEKCLHFTPMASSLTLNTPPNTFAPRAEVV
jgi:hypothetical protein